jgi:hypothetical protein
MSDRVLQFVAERATALNTVLLAVMVAIAFCSARPGSRWFRAVRRGLGLIAQRRRLSVALVGLLALFGSAGVSLLTHIPQPRIHDEFSYLLAADTFAHGRVTNPPHPLWVHFESYHIIHQPTYASKYPPAQGLILAAGQVIGGHPIVGIWISIGLACAAICWMLQGWLPPRWALLGGLLAVLHPGLLLRWGQNYWGGAMAVIGGALVFGALRRIVRRPPRVHNAMLMGVGLAILANSRPFEGLIVSLPVALVLLGWMIGKNGPAVGVSMRRIALPILAVLALTGTAMGYYNLRVTGDPLRMPYQVHEMTYVMRPFFIFRDYSRPEPTYRHEVMLDYYRPGDRKRETYRQKIVPDLYDMVPIVGTALRRTHELSRPVMKRVKRLWKFYFGLVLTVPLIMLPWVLRDKWMRFALLTCGVLIAILVSRWFIPHYGAPMTALVFLIVLQSMRHLRLWRWHGKPAGQLTVQAIPVICAAWLILSLGQKVPVKPAHAWSLERARMLAELKKDGEPHLVIVRYPAKYPWTKGEWVYNEADIDRAKVVWAREMDADQNLRLLEYFNDRQVWLLEVGQNRPPFKLVSYPGRLKPMKSPPNGL